MAVITFSRQFGSSGDEIAARVCEALNYRYFDKQLLIEAASQEYVTPEQVVDYHEDSYKMRSIMDRLRGYRRPPVGQRPTVRRDAHDQIGENMLVWLADAAVRAAYVQGNFVIVGRAGQAILMDKPGVLHVRIEAPIEKRITHVSEQQNLSAAAARLIVAEHDRAATDYLRRFYGINAADPLLYHLVINTGRFDVEAAVDIVVQSVAHLAPAREDVTPEASGEAAPVAEMA
jgi:CMP/dCMP kinase